MLHPTDFHQLNHRLRMLGFRSLAAYFETDLWKKNRKRFPKKACAACFSTEFIQLHHRSYANLGNEKPGDCIWMCCDCHSTIHARINQTRCRIWEATAWLIEHFNTSDHRPARPVVPKTDPNGKPHWPVMHGSRKANAGRGAVDLNVGYNPPCKVYHADPFDL